MNPNPKIKIPNSKRFTSIPTVSGSPVSPTEEISLFIQNEIEEEERQSEELLTKLIHNPFSNAG